MTVQGDRRLRIAFGWLAAGVLVAFLGGAFLVLFLSTDAVLGLLAIVADPYIRGVVLFTLEQAGLSTLFSVGLAVPLALALHRTRFYGRDAVLRLFLLPQALPVLVGALAIIAIWGRNGLSSNLLVALGLPRLDIYGLSGILVAHVFFNLPLATRLLLSALDRVPTESFKLAGQLSLTPFAVFRLLEAPAIRAGLPGAASLVFMLCVTSFTIVLILGGGPAATTLEVAIYQALRYDFDPGRAIALSVLQIGITALVLWLATRLGGDLSASFGHGGTVERYDPPSRMRRTIDIAILAVGFVFIVSPFAAVLWRGLTADLVGLLAEPAVRRAIFTSLAVSLAAACLSVVVSTAIILAMTALGTERSARAGTKGHRTDGARPNGTRGTGRLTLETIASLVLVVPPIVVGAGWFLALRQVTDIFAAAPYVVVATNAAMAVPFVVRIVAPALQAEAATTGKLADGLGLVGLTRLRFVDWPAMRPPLALAFAFALAISLGDLGAIALYGSRDFTTLPYLLMQRMGSYRSDDAAGLALILGVLCLGLMTLAERGLSARVHGAERRPS